MVENQQRGKLFLLENFLMQRYIPLCEINEFYGKNSSPQVQLENKDDVLDIMKSAFSEFQTTFWIEI